jgi:hypothetical protein
MEFPLSFRFKNIEICVEAGDNLHQSHHLDGVEDMEAQKPGGSAGELAEVSDGKG